MCVCAREICIEFVFMMYKALLQLSSSLRSTSSAWKREEQRMPTEWKHLWLLKPCLSLSKRKT